MTEDRKCMCKYKESNLVINSQICTHSRYLMHIDNYMIFNSGQVVNCQIAHPLDLNSYALNLIIPLYFLRAFPVSPSVFKEFIKTSGTLTPYFSFKF